MAGPTSGASGSRDAPEEALERYRAAVHDSTRLARLFSVLGLQEPLDVLVDRALLALSELFAADVVLLLRPQPGKPPLVLGAIGLPEDPALPPFSGAPEVLSISVFRSHAPAVIAGARAEPRLDAPLRALEVEEAVYLPVPGGQELHAVLVLARCAPRPFSRQDVEQLSAAALRIGLVLAQARAQEIRQALDAAEQKAQKEESLGRMAGALAHRFNNILGAATGSLEVALAELPAGHPAAGEIGHALASLRDAAHLSGLLRAYLGQGSPWRQPVDLGAACGLALEALRRSLPGGVRLRADLGGEPLAVLADPAGLEVVVANLLDNAAEAIDAEGEIAVSLRAVPAAEVVATQVPSPGWRPQAARYACLEVTDTGRGIGSAALGSLFDPFYTTKASGLGLGLAVTWGTVRAHEGAMAVESVPGRGSRFRVFLPLAAAPVPAARAPAPASPRPAVAGGLALVVDDEPNVLRAARRLLKTMGYQALTAGSGEEAIRAFRERAAEVRFVLLDLTMPRMDGWQVLAALRAIRPGVPVVLASGYDQAHVMSGALPAQLPVFLPKPYSREELEQAIAAASAEG